MARWHRPPDIIDDQRNDERAAERAAWFRKQHTVDAKRTAKYHSDPEFRIRHKLHAATAHRKSAPITLPKLKCLEDAE